MQITAELSLYPLTKDYEEVIIGFIKKLQENSNLHVKTHSMSTFVKGLSTEVFTGINSALASVNENQETVSLVIKLVNRDLPVEKGFLNF